MKQSLTVVLPVRNAESTLRRHVSEVLEMAGDLTDKFGILIVDDGSTDDTFDMAVELATRFPQIKVMRNAHQRGLGPTLRAVRAQVKSEIVVVHDGVSAIDANQIRELWLTHNSRTRQTQSAAPASASVDDLRCAVSTHRVLADAHACLLGFQLLHSAASSDDGSLTRRESPKQRGVGVIPPLPRPNFMGSLANFALGE